MSDESIEPGASRSPKKRKPTHSQIEVDLSAPEPPSKKARRALKKGKPLPPKPASHDEASLTKGDAIGDSESGKTLSEHSVWIGNLPFTTTAAELRKWLVQNSGGVITDECITRVKMPTSRDPPKETKTKPNKGFAYVDFDSLAAKISAIALSESILASRRLLIKDSNSFEGRPEKKTGEANTELDGNREKRPPPRKIFVGNLSFTTTEDDLWAHFEKCGEVDWVKVATFEDTGKCKGFGWVQFKTADGAAWAAKGFVKVKEEVETEEDFRPVEEREDGEQSERKVKMRKWWVNKLQGRKLKLELAEDDQTRYNKRFRGRKRHVEGSGDVAIGSADGDAARPGKPQELRT